MLVPQSIYTYVLAVYTAVRGLRYNYLAIHEFYVMNFYIHLATCITH